MDIIKVLNNLESLNIEQFLDVWKDEKDIFMIKYDGIRKCNKHTILILGYESRFETIRVDCDDIIKGIKTALLKYKEYTETEI